jgi:hypothetical protein
MRLWKAGVRDVVALWHAYERELPGSGWEQLARYLYKLYRGADDALPEMPGQGEGEKLDAARLVEQGLPYVPPLLQHVPQALPEKGVIMVRRTPGGDWCVSWDFSPGQTGKES